MDERRPRPARSGAGFRIYQFDTAPEIPKHRLNVLHLEGRVVETFATLGEKPADRRVGAGGLEKLDSGLPHPDHSGDDALLPDSFGLPDVRAETVAVEAGGGVQILDRVSEVVNPLQHSSPFARVTAFHSRDRRMSALDRMTFNRAEASGGTRKIVAKSVMQTIQELSEERERLLAREGAHYEGHETHQRLLKLDHDLQVLWDLRRRELAGENIDLDDDYFDRYTVDPGSDAPGGGRTI